MKRTWDIEELIEHFTLMPADEELLGNKTRATRLGFAVLLKCFQLDGRFPSEAWKLRLTKRIVMHLKTAKQKRRTLLVEDRSASMP